MTLAIFDLDNTLIAGDSDHLWGEFLIEQGLVDPKAYKIQNDQFYQDYKKSCLDIRAYLNFALSPLAKYSQQKLADLHRQFMADKIQPIILPAAMALINQHRAKNHTLLIITATNRFVTGPIAKKLGIDHLLASEAERVDGAYTGQTTGTPCYQEGKVTRLEQWLADTGHSIQGSYFYSDSANDIPLLDYVSNPVAVDPDERLRHYAKEKGFAIISLRQSD